MHHYQYFTPINNKQAYTYNILWQTKYNCAFCFKDLQMLYQFSTFKPKQKSYFIFSIYFHLSEQIFEFQQIEKNSKYLCGFNCP